MKTRIHILFSVLVLCSFSAVRAQVAPPSPPPAHMRPPVGMDRMDPMSKPAKSYEDSAEFAKVFKEFYPLVAPKQSVKEAAEQQFARMSRGFKQQGIDSAEAYKAAMKGLDLDANQKIYFTVYRENMSAKELKAYMAFMKTAEGKHIIEVLPQLQRASGESGNYAQRTIMTNLRPLQQAAREKMMKENPPKEGDRNPPMGDRSGRGMPPGMRMPPRDSLMRSIPPPPPPQK